MKKENELLKIRFCEMISLCHPPYSHFTSASGQTSSFILHFLIFSPPSAINCIAEGVYDNGQENHKLRDIQYSSQNFIYKNKFT